MQIATIACAVAVATGITLAGTARAQQPAGTVQPQALKRTFLQTFDVPSSNYQAIMGTSELGPNRVSRRESHPGPEAGYVLQGSGSMLVDEQPPLQLKAGQSYKLTSGAVHEVRSGADGLKLIITWIVEKNKPFASPAN